MGKRLRSEEATGSSFTIFLQSASSLTLCHRDGASGLSHPGPRYLSFAGSSIIFPKLSLLLRRNDSESHRGFAGRVPALAGRFAVHKADSSSRPRHARIGLDFSVLDPLEKIKPLSACPLPS